MIMRGVHIYKSRVLLAKTCNIRCVTLKLIVSTWLYLVPMFRPLWNMSDVTHVHKQQPTCITCGSVQQYSQTAKHQFVLESIGVAPFLPRSCSQLYTVSYEAQYIHAFDVSTSFHWDSILTHWLQKQRIMTVEALQWWRENQQFCMYAGGTRRSRVVVLCTKCHHRRNVHGLVWCLVLIL